jgi:uncharacterized protein YbjT (DUF2867 family)
MIVVSGATGNVGRPLVAALTAAGAEVRGFSRNGPGAVADLTDPASLAPVLAGAESLYLLVSGAGSHVDGRAVVAAARAAGLRRIVLQSSQAAGTRPDLASHAPLRALEDLVRDSGLQWTVLRPGGFASNAFAWAESIRATGTAYAPYADVALPIVDPADIAAVAAAALLDDRHAGRTYTLTGPEPTTPPERAAAIAAATGSPVRFVEQTPQEAREQMLAFMPPPVADGTLAILGRPLPAERSVSPDVEAVLGRKPGSFADWAARNAAAFG